jgi:EAL domain-containing protein (putative c-di-GMP-specific phosphodiesterase class I)
MHLGNALRVALDEKQFELYFQPQIDAQSGWIVGLEALIRWRHPEKGLIPPDRFIPLAEEMRLISAIGAWVIDEACRIVAEWRKIGIHGLRVAVNLSAQQLRQNDLVDIVRTALEHHRLTGNDLELEVTESMVMEDPDLCIAQLQRLKALGITLAMDDFGTGYSSLAYLKRLPIDTLKIDRSFVRDLEIDDNDKVICATTISMANSLGLDTVAEGVETGDQARVLRELNCNRFQGYFYARPMPAAAATDFIRQQAAGRAFSSTSA